MRHNQILELLRGKLGDVASRSEIKQICQENNLDFPRFIFADKTRRVSRGQYSLIETVGLPKQPQKVNAPSIQMNVAPVSSDVDLENFIPVRDELYSAWGNHKQLKKVIQSRKFFPTFITGHSGNGKTMMVEQLCAELGREFFRVNVTRETDEDDLLGGFRLVDDCTKWFDGPVVRAMKRGGVLLLDEVDLATGSIMCLQPVLEGRGVLLKKINKFVQPAPGFTVIATANTKGKGDDNGRYMFTNILNEAFLERFPITMEQPYPNELTEKKILAKVFSSNGYSERDSEDIIDHFVKWAQSTRETFEKDGADEIISTRRLVHISHAYAIFEDKNKAVEYCISRFDDATKESFLALFKNLDPVEIRAQEQAKAEAEKIKADARQNKEDTISSIFGGNP